MMPAPLPMGLAGFRKLAQKDNVAAVIGQYHSSVCLAVNKVAQDLGVPLFSTGASSPDITPVEKCIYLQHHVTDTGPAKLDRVAKAWA